MPFAAGLSQHPVTATAVGEAVGHVLESLGGAPDLVALFVTRHHAGALEDAAGVVRAVLAPSVLVGCAAAAVVGGPLEVEDGPGLALWAGRLGPVVAVRLTLGADGGVCGWPPPLAFRPQALVLLADPFGLTAQQALGAVAATHPGLPVVGGMVTGGRGPGGSRLLLGDRVVVDGAVGALVGPGAGVEVAVSQGWRPVGPRLTVTRAERGVVYELAGEAPLERLRALARGDLDAEDAALLGTGLGLGLAVDEHRVELSREDFVVHAVLGADRSNGAMALSGAEVQIGTTAQFHLRGPAAATEDLHHVLASRRAGAALLFPSDGRGRRLFGVRHHDAATVDEVLGPVPAAGFFPAGCFGRIGAHNRVLGLSLSAALFTDPQPGEGRSGGPPG